jgi:predicted  nucleic acid-binding Zn-ribbon protein
MNEDCLNCGTGMHNLDEDRLCPGCLGCSPQYYNYWEKLYREQTTTPNSLQRELLNNLSDLYED